MIIYGGALMKELREAINNATLTKTQKMIARYILDNSADACFMTSTEIAEQLGVSESSVIRFSRSRSSVEEMSTIWGSARVTTSEPKVYGVSEISEKRLSGQSFKYLQLNHDSFSENSPADKAQQRYRLH